MPPAQSFIVPTVRVDSAGNGWNLFVIHPGDTLPDGSVRYDALWLSD